MPHTYSTHDLIYNRSGSRCHADLRCCLVRTKCVDIGLQPPKTHSQCPGANSTCRSTCQICCNRSHSLPTHICIVINKEVCHLCSRRKVEQHAALCACFVVGTQQPHVQQGGQDAGSRWLRCRHARCSAGASIVTANSADHIVGRYRLPTEVAIMQHRRSRISLHVLFLQSSKGPVLRKASIRCACLH